MEEIGNPALTPFPVITELLRSVPRLWRGNRLPVVAGPTCPTGFPELDRELPGGGWPTGAVVEFLSDTGGIGELRLLLPALQRMTQAGNHVLLIQPPHVPNAVVLQRAGIQLNRVLVARPEHEQDTLWMAEQALRNPGCGAVLAWPGARRGGFNDERVRRLQMAAEDGQSTLFLYRAGRRQVSQWATLRLELLPLPLPVRETTTGMSEVEQGRERSPREKTASAVLGEGDKQGLQVSVLKAVGTHRRPQVQVFFGSH
jgi:hypothetical protein